MKAIARSTWGLWIAGMVGLTGYVGMVALDARVGTLRDEFTPQTIAWYLVAFAGFLIALWWNERHAIPFFWLWAVPILFRVLLLATTPTLSDDVYRYIWDGNVAASGLNPYAFPLDSPALDSIEIPARDLANNPSLSTPYLPTAQLAFAATALLAPANPLSLQIVMVGFDLAAAGLIVLLLGATGLPRGRVMLYLWNPLVVVEVAHGAHLDSLMVFLALLAVYLTLAGRERGVGWGPPIALALATLTRPLPLLLLTVLWWRWRWSHRVAYFAIVGGGLSAFAWSAGWGLTGEPVSGVFGSVRVYGRWVFNGALFPLFADIFGGSATAARYAAAAAMVVTLLAVWSRSRGRRDALEVVRAMVVPIAAYVLLTPILHPWYVLILIALLPFVVSQGGGVTWLRAAPWLYLTAALAFSYLTYLDPLRHAEVSWVRGLEWYPTFALLVLSAGADFLGRRRSAFRSPAASNAVTGSALQSLPVATGDSDGQGSASSPDVPQPEPG